MVARVKGRNDRQGSDDGSRKKHHAFRDPDPDQKVGPGSPPAEYRWPKGHCPNPAGRPRRKIREMKMPEGLKPLQRVLLEHARKPVGEFNGETISRYERLLISLEAHAHEQPAIAKTLLQLISEADRENSKREVETLRGALDYKEKMEPVFAMAEKAGRPPPPIYPHPDDVIILSDSSVRIDGPRTAQEARDLDMLLQYRDFLFMMTEEAMDYPEDVRSAEETRRIWASLRRKFYRIHRRIPRRLHLSFPKFRLPPPEEMLEPEA